MLQEGLGASEISQALEGSSYPTLDFKNKNLIFFQPTVSTNTCNLLNTSHFYLHSHPLVSRDGFHDLS
jgi:hypothetical protein